MTDNLEDKKFDAINPDSIIDLKINGKFFGDLKGVLMYYLTQNNRSKEDMAKILDHISKGKIESEEEYPLYVLFEFLTYIEGQAKEQGYIIQDDVPQDITAEFPENQHSETRPSE